MRDHRKIMKKVKHLKKSLQRKKTTEGVLLQDSSPSVFNIKEVFFENDTREVGCVHSEVHVKEDDLDNSISMDDDDCFLSYLDNEKTSSVAHIQGKWYGILYLLVFHHQHT
jgi:hypothetical protein